MSETTGLGGGVENFELVPVHDRSNREMRVLPQIAATARLHAGSQVRYRAVPRGKPLLGCEAIHLGRACGSQEPFRLERCHAAHAGGGHGLAIDIVGYVASCEYA